MCLDPKHIFVIVILSRLLTHVELLRWVSKLQGVPEKRVQKFEIRYLSQKLKYLYCSFDES